MWFVVAESSVNRVLWLVVSVDGAAVGGSACAVIP